MERNYLKEWSDSLKGEIDIIAQKQDTLFFVKVKTSAMTKAPYNIDCSKIRQAIKAAHSWLVEKNISLSSKWQVDIVSLNIDLDSKSAKVRHFKNAFF